MTAPTSTSGMTTPARLQRTRKKEDAMTLKKFDQNDQSTWPDPEAPVLMLMQSRTHRWWSKVIRRTYGKWWIDGLHYDNACQAIAWMEMPPTDVEVSANSESQVTK